MTLKTLIATAPDEVRESLVPRTDRRRIDRCAALQPGDIINPPASVKHALRALATRWRTLLAESARRSWERIENDRTIRRRRPCLISRCSTGGESGTLDI